MAQMANPSRHADLGAGVAPLDQQGSAAAVPVLDSILPIADGVLADYESRRFARRPAEEPETIDIDLDLAEEMLAKAVTLDRGATHVDSVRAQLGSIVHGLAAPSQAVASATASAPPVVTASVAAPVVRPDVRAVATERMNRQLARRVVDLTLRAEAAEAKLRSLEAQVAAEQANESALGRRFGQLAHESFPVFVARLGMSAKLRLAERGKADKVDQGDSEER